MPWAVAAAAVATGGTIYSANKQSGAAKQLASNQTTSVDPWLSGGSQFAVDQAKRYAQRPYQAFQGQRVADLAGNQQQAGTLASRYATGVGSTFGQAPSATQLSAFENPYVDDVLGARKRSINEEYGRQAAALTQNQAATDAFRNGRSDLARSRLAFNHMRALDEATAETKSGAFDRAMSNYFQNQNQQQGAFQTAVQGLSGTGAIDRAHNQQLLDQDYQNFLDKRDWNVNNLGPLLQSISAAKGNVVQNGAMTQSQQQKDPWGAIGGLLGQSILTFTGNKSNTPSYQNTTPAFDGVANSGVSGPRE